MMSYLRSEFVDAFVKPGVVGIAPFDVLFESTVRDKQGGASRGFLSQTYSGLMTFIRCRLITTECDGYFYLLRNNSLATTAWTSERKP